MKPLSTCNTLLSIILPLCLIGCGGGGGDDFATPNYAGAWNTYVSLVNNSCPRAIPEEFLAISVLHNVHQNLSEDSLGNHILDIVLDDGVDTYVGVGEIGTNGIGNRFSVTGSPHELPGFLNSFTCIEILNFDYDSITKGELEDRYANFVTRHSSITCRRGDEIQTCDVTYTGSSISYHK